MLEAIATLGASLVVHWERNHLPRQEMEETWVPSMDQENPLEEEVEAHPLQYSCLGNPTDRGRILMGYSPWGCKEWDTTA